MVSTKRMIREIVVIGVITIMGFWALWIAYSIAFSW